MTTSQTTNPNDLEKELASAIAALPLPIQEIIAKDDWKPWVAEVVKKNNLNLDQASVLEAEVFMLMIGVSNLETLRKHLHEEANLVESAITQVVVDINSIIIDPLKQRLIDKTLTANIETSITNSTQKNPSSPSTKAPLSSVMPTKPAPAVEIKTPIFTAMPQHIESTTESREALLRAIENPEPSKGFTPPVVKVAPPITQTSTPPTITAPTPVTPAPSVNSSNILATKLGAVVSSPVKTETKIVFTAPPSIKTPASSDPYRESIE